MKKQLYLKKTDVIYWIDECPINKEENLKVECRQYNIQGDVKCEPQKLAMELYLHKDVNSYGGLGIEFLCNSRTDRLRVFVKYVEENRVSYKSELAKYDNYIFYGLPEECVETLFEKIHRYIQLNMFPSGDLVISYAVNSEVRSSPLFFGILLDILLNIFIKINTCSNQERKEFDNFIETEILKSILFKDNGSCISNG